MSGTTDQFFPVDSKDSVYFAFPQSELYKRMEARDEFERTARGEPEDSMPVTPYKPLPLFPTSAHTLMIWGLDGVLVNISASIEAAYKERTVEALQKLLPEGTFVDKADVCKLVHKGYVENGQPCKYVAEKYGVNQGMLQVDMLSLVAYKDIALNPQKYGMGDQGLLNYFEASRQKGVKHAVVTSATEGFAKTCLHFSVLDQYMSAVFGAGARRGNEGQMMPKNSNPSEYLDSILPGKEFGDRYPSIIVVDHNLDFLSAAKSRNMKTVLIDPNGKYNVKPSEADYLVRTPEQAFEQALGMKNPGHRRDANYSHVYSGAGGLPLSSSPK